MAYHRTAIEWEREYDRIYPGVLNPHRNAALGPVGDVFEALGSAQARAAIALRDGHIRYSGRLGFTELNLLENWLWYAALTRMRPRPDVLAGARKYMRLQIKVYRAFMDQERNGIVGRLEHGIRGAAYQPSGERRITEEVSACQHIERSGPSDHAGDALVLDSEDA